MPSHGLLWYYTLQTTYRYITQTNFSLRQNQGQLQLYLQLFWMILRMIWKEKKKNTLWHLLRDQRLWNLYKYAKLESGSVCKMRWKLHCRWCLQIVLLQRVTGRCVSKNCNCCVQVFLFFLRGFPAFANFDAVKNVACVVGSKLLLRTNSYDKLSIVYVAQQAQNSLWVQKCFKNPIHFFP